ncbi:hypothetical protein PENSPDRAFT_220563 [Peniophora sp. CONT]|nr:hypothetical protein PENSPDRAFT_220563 [Peniophora sp. CONT]
MPNDCGSTVLVDHRKLTLIVADRAFPLLIETYLYALYTVLTVYFVYRRWLDRERTSLTVFMLLVTLAMFILFTAYWAIDIYLLWIEVYRYLPLQRSDSHSKAMFLDGLWIPWSTVFYKILSSKLL